MKHNLIIHESENHVYNLLDMEAPTIVNFSKYLIVRNGCCYESTVRIV